jgi:putative SOS response-associated peptidase YedK
MNNPDTPPKPIAHEQPSPEGLDGTICSAFVLRDGRGWPFMVASRDGVLWDHYWQRNTNTWTPVSPIKTMEDLHDRMELAMPLEEQAKYLPNSHNISK